MIWRKKNAADFTLPDIRLNAERVIVRTAREEDAEEWLALRHANKGRLIALEPKWADDALTHDYFARRLARQAADWNEDRAYCFVIEHVKKGYLIGGVNLNSVIRGAAQHAQLGYWIDKDFEGKGYMSAALRLVIPHALDVLKLKRLNAATLPENERSINLLKKVGFEEEGFAKKYLQINGVWRDHILFGLTS